MWKENIIFDFIIVLVMILIWYGLFLILIILVRVLENLFRFSGMCVMDFIIELLFFFRK